MKNVRKMARCLSVALAGWPSVRCCHSNLRIKTIIIVIALAILANVYFVYNCVLCCFSEMAEGQGQGRSAEGPRDDP